MSRVNRRSGGSALKGRRVAVTRPSGQAEALMEGLRRLGADPIACPTIGIADPENTGALAAALRQLESYDWIVFTSVNGVGRFWSALEETMGDAKLPGRLRGH